MTDAEKIAAIRRLIDGYKFVFVDQIIRILDDEEPL